MCLVLLQSRVLVCTPSNSAADLIVERLPPNWTEIMHRMMAYSRHPRHHSDAVKRFCNPVTAGGGEHFAPTELKQLLTKRVVVATCMTAGVIYALGVGDDFFTHIIIDEVQHLLVVFACRRSNELSSCAGRPLH